MTDDINIVNLFAHNNCAVKIRYRDTPALNFGVFQNWRFVNVPIDFPTAQKINGNQRLPVTVNKTHNKM